MAEDPQLKVQEIDKRVKANGKIDEADLAKLIEFVKADTVPKGQPGYTHLWAVAVLALIKEHAPGQKERIWNACTPLFASEDPNDQRAAMEIAAVHRNPEAAKLVVPLTRSKHEGIRKRAVEYLKSIGYSPSD